MASAPTPAGGNGVVFSAVESSPANLDLISVPNAPLLVRHDEASLIGAGDSPVRLAAAVSANKAPSSDVVAVLTKPHDDHAVPVGCGAHRDRNRHRYP
jgi:hypothetical protein